MENSSRSYKIEGYIFDTEKDAKLAELDRKKIEYLREKIDYSKPDSILKVYDKAVSENVFKTPVGTEFLREMQVFLTKCPEIPNQDIRPIPIPARPEPQKKNSKGQVLGISIMLNIVLAIAVAAMFYITVNSDQPNILNYEKAITNRYASWEQELTEREQAVREKEREFNIQTE